MFAREKLQSAQRLDIVLGVCIALTAMYSAALTPLAPSLLAHPVLLELLRGSPVAIITAGGTVRAGETTWLTALAAGLAGAIMLDWLYWWAGSRWGRTAMSVVLVGRPRLAASSHRLEALMRRWGAPLVLVSYWLPIPVVIIEVAAGCSGMSLRRFLLADTLGALLWVGILVVLGFTVGRPAVELADTIARYGLYFGIALVTLGLVRAIPQIMPRLGDRS